MQICVVRFLKVIYELVFMEDEEGHFKGCDTCKTDSYLMNIKEQD